MSIDLQGYKVVVLGGDERETETLRLLKENGADIDAYGAPASAEKVLGRVQSSSLSQALAGANILLCPIPLPETDGSLYAPHFQEKINLNPGTLSGVAPGAVIITGVASSGMRAAAEQLGLILREYERDEDLMILRSASIAEGAISTVIQNSLVSIHQSNVLVVGFGRIGLALGHLLIGMRARAYTATPLPLEQARAYEVGLTVYPLEQLSEVVGKMDIIFNTIPIQVFERSMLERLSADALLIDIVAPPGGVDRDAAKELGSKFIWARGLGRFGPRTVAKSQWMGVERILRDIHPEL
jgi:dipicolinate synthase subunit A